MSSSKSESESKPAPSPSSELDAWIDHGRPLWLLLVLVFSGVMIYHDPFGLSEQSDRLASLVYNNMMAPFYGQEAEVELGGNKYIARQGQSQIIVILVDDHYLEATRQLWPLPASVFQALFESLTEAGSAAIFLDVYFRKQGAHERRQDVEALYRDASTQNLHDCEDKFTAGSPGPTPIVFASMKHDPILSLQSGRKLNLNPALIEMKDDLGRYQLACDTRGPGCGLTVPTGAEAPSLPEWIPSPALRLFHCWARHAGLKPNQMVRSESAAQQPMHLQWGYAPGDVQMELQPEGGKKCPRVQQGLVQAIGQSVSLLRYAAFEQFNDPVLDRCLYHTQVSLSYVNDLNEEEMAELFGQRIVLIGASLNLHRDKHRSPTHGSVPGVFLHAMALDNLIEYGPRYLKLRDDQTDKSDKSVQIVLNSILLILVTWVGVRIKRRSATRRALTQSVSGWQEIPSWVLTTTLATLLVSAVVLALLLKDWAPRNWLGIAAVLGLALAPDAFAEASSAPSGSAPTGRWCRFGAHVCEAWFTLLTVVLCVSTAVLVFALSQLPTMILPRTSAYWDVLILMCAALYLFVLAPVLGVWLYRRTRDEVWPDRSAVGPVVSGPG